MNRGINVCFKFCTDEENGHYTNFYNSMIPRMIDRETETVMMSLTGKHYEIGNFNQVDYSCEQNYHFFFFSSNLLFK